MLEEKRQKMPKTNNLISDQFIFGSKWVLLSDIIEDDATQIIVITEN